MKSASTPRNSSRSTPQALSTSAADGLSSMASNKCSTVMNSCCFCLASTKAMCSETSSSCAIMMLPRLAKRLPETISGDNALTLKSPPSCTVTDVDASARCRRSEEHTSELQSHHDLVCRLLLEK